MKCHSCQWNVYTHGGVCCNEPTDLCKPWQGKYPCYVPRMAAVKEKLVRARVALKRIMEAYTNGGLWLRLCVFNLRKEIGEILDESQD